MDYFRFVRHPLRVELTVDEWGKLIQIHKIAT
jgi:hypothetical protein